jgi:hypothetical protein
MPAMSAHLTCSSSRSAGTGNDSANEAAKSSLLQDDDAKHPARLWSYHSEVRRALCRGPYFSTSTGTDPDTSHRREASMWMWIVADTSQPMCSRPSPPCIESEVATMRLTSKLVYKRLAAAKGCSCGHKLPRGGPHQVGGPRGKLGDHQSTCRPEHGQASVAFHQSHGGAPGTDRRQLHCRTRSTVAQEGAEIVQQQLQHTAAFSCWGVMAGYCGCGP